MKQKVSVCILGNPKSPHTKSRSQVFAQRGHTVDLIGGDKSDKIQGVSIFPSEITKKYKILNLFYAYWIAWKVLKNKSYDVVHAHSANIPTVWMAAIMGNNRLIVSTMGSDILRAEFLPASKIYKQLITKVFQQSVFITGESQFLLSQLKRFGEFDEKVQRVHWGIDLSIFEPTEGGGLRESLGLSEHDRVLFCPRILKKLYNIDLLIAAMPQILTEHPQTKLILTSLFADTQYQAEIITLIETLGLQNNILILEKIEHHLMPAYYAISDVVVSIPSSDNLPRTLLESLACQVPVIIGNLPQYKEVVQHLESAYFVEFSAESIAKGVKQLLSDDNLRTTLIENSYKTIETFGSFDEQADIVESLYYTVAQRPKQKQYIRWRMILLAFAYYINLYLIRLFRLNRHQKSVICLM